MKNSYEHVLKQWAEEWRSENIDARTNKAINLAVYDLWYSAPSDGSTMAPPTDEFGNENEWAGYNFGRACVMIKEAIKDLPRELYIDEDTGFCSEAAPEETEECPDCEGTGEQNDYETNEPMTCTTCNGAGKIEAYLDCWVKVEYNEIKQAVIGKTLAEYV